MLVYKHLRAVALQLEAKHPRAAQIPGLLAFESSLSVSQSVSQLNSLYFFKVIDVQNTHWYFFWLSRSALPP